MKYAAFFCLCSLACGGALAQSVSSGGAIVAVSTEQAAVQSHVGFVKSVQGNVQLITAAGAVSQCLPGTKIMPTDRMVSGPDGAAGLVLRDGTKMVLGPSSQLEVKQFAFDSTTLDGTVLVSLLRGSLRMISGLIGKINPEAVRIETQTATIGIRGTDFIVLADAPP